MLWGLAFGLVLPHARLGNLKSVMVEEPMTKETVQEKILTAAMERGKLPDSTYETIATFITTYLDVVTNELERDPTSVVDVLEEYIGMVESQIEAPYKFAPYHQAVLEPDHYTMDTSFMEPLIDMDDSVLLGAEHVKTIRDQLDAGDNVVLLSNHQTEADPSAWSALFDRGDEAWRDEALAKQMIMVAGDRVTTDPVAVPFSKARNLLCIYSKRHMDNPPDQKRMKQLHNTRTMGAFLKLLTDGGNMVWVAPSGGRDRPDDDGDFSAPAKFDSKSVDMFRLMASKVSLLKKTHFWPTAMLTYTLFPPPPKVQSSLGEPRIAMRGSVNAAFGPELDFAAVEALAEGDDKDTTRAKVADFAYNACKDLYDKLLENANERNSPYYSQEARRLSAQSVLAKQ